jgi:uncharacterized repeat protein (TIGR03847 family)
MTTFAETGFMAYYGDDEVYPVTRITAGAVGDLGRRVFIIQAHYGQDTASWVIEKGQAVALSRALPRLLDDVRAEYPELSDPLVAAEPDLELNEPLEPQFRVGSIGVSYDRIHDLVVLTLVDADAEDGESVELRSVEGYEEEPELQIYTTRGQALLLGRQAEVVVTAGRPACPRCGDPIDDFGHFCLPAEARGRFGGAVLQ